MSLFHALEAKARLQDQLDDARAEVERQRQERWRVAGELAQALRERDEARAEVARLRGQEA